MPQGITVLGLGPGGPELLTAEAQEVLRAAPELYVRTRRHPAVEALPCSAVVHSFDALYDGAATFEEVYDEIAARVLELGGRPEGVVYAVPGHPLAGEASVLRVLALAEEKGLPVRIVEGVSFLEPLFTKLRLDPLAGLQVADATVLATRHHPECNPDLPLFVGQLYSRALAADVKLALMAVYPDEHAVVLVGAAGTTTGWARTIKLYELDRYDGIDHLTSLYVPPLPTPGSLSALQEVVAHLRAPGGCPWDREQTHRSLRPYLLEETYEVLQALDDEDPEALSEELGDLLLQVLLHTQIAIEEGEFKMADVAGHIVAKLKRRHPHVFADVQVSGAKEVLVNWEQIKKGEKRARAMAEGHDEPCGIGASVPLSLPALTRAQSVQSRAARRGFDWPDVGRVWAKVEEEWAELRAAEGADARESELGDALFALVSVARWLGVDAESALRQATQRFEQRFGEVEGAAAAKGQPLGRLGLSELEALWGQAKKRTAGPS